MAGHVRRLGSKFYKWLRRRFDRVMAIAAIAVALIALLVSVKSNRLSLESNQIAREANEFNELQVNLELRRDFEPLFRLVRHMKVDKKGHQYDVIEVVNQGKEVLEFNVDTLDFITDVKGLPILPVYYWDAAKLSDSNTGVLASFESYVEVDFPVNYERNQLKKYVEIKEELYRKSLDVRSFLCIDYLNIAEQRKCYCFEIAIEPYSLRVGHRLDPSLCEPLWYAFHGFPYFEKKPLSDLTQDDIEPFQDLNLTTREIKELRGLLSN